MAKEITGTLSRKSPVFAGEIGKNIGLFEAEIPGSLQISVGTEGPPGKTPVKGVDYFTEDDISEIVEEVKKSFSGDITIETDETLKLENGILSVNTTNEIEEDNTLPITSAGVFATVGNIEALLNTI